MLSRIFKILIRNDIEIIFVYNRLNFRLYFLRLLVEIMNETVMNFFQKLPSCELTRKHYVLA